MPIHSVSVIIPVFNGEAFLAESVNSVIHQSRSPHEIIIVDDGSTDGTSSLIEELRARSPLPVIHLRQNNKGPAAARNHGLRFAKGDIIAFQDADDIWTTHKLETQLQVLDNYANAGGARGLVQLFRRIPGQEDQPPVEERNPATPLLCLQSILVHRHVIDEVGLLNENMRYGEDVDWMMRVQEKGIHIVEHPDVVLLYRRHVGSMTMKYEKARSGTIEAIALSLKRRKSQTPEGHHGQ